MHVRSSSQHHSFPGFWRGLYTLIRSVQSADKVFFGYTFCQCLTCHSPFWDRELGSMFVIALLQPWLSTCNTGATPSGSSLFHLCWQILHLCVLQLFLLWNGHLCTHLALKHVVIRAQSSVFLTWKNIFCPRHSSGICFLGMFWCQVWGTFSQKYWQ